MNLIKELIYLCFYKLFVLCYSYIMCLLFRVSFVLEGGFDLRLMLSQQYVGNGFVVRYKNKYYQLKEEQPVTVLKKSKVIVETSIEGGIRVRQKGKYLNFFVLPSKPKKEMEARCIALTRKKSSWKPPQDHPWRRYRSKVEK